MFKKLKGLSALMLTVVIGVNTAYADVNMPPDKFKDPEKQFNYVRQIVIDGIENTWSKYKLAQYYEKGYGTNKNIIKAYVWYHFASTVKPPESPLGIKEFNALKASMTKEQIAEGDKQWKQIETDMYARDSAYGLNQTPTKEARQKVIKDIAEGDKDWTKIVDDLPSADKPFA